MISCRDCGEVFERVEDASTERHSCRMKATEPPKGAETYAFRVGGRYDPIDVTITVTPDDEFPFRVAVETMGIAL